MIATVQNKFSGLESFVYMAEAHDNYISIMKELLPESLLMQEAVDLDTVRRLFHYFCKFFDGLAKIIDFAISKIKALFKIFQARAKDVQMGNSDFIAKYGAKLERIAHVAVNLEGFRINTEITAYGNEIGMLAGANFSDLKMIVLDGKIAFNNTDDIDAAIAKNRFSILGSNEYITNSRYLSDVAFQDELHHKYYGRKLNNTYIVHDALNVIKNYRFQYENAKRLNDLTVTNGNNDIREIEKLKSLFKARTISGRLGLDKDDLVQQLSMLAKYRTSTLNDSIYAFSVILKYIDDANLQAKSICIKALQEN